MDIQITRDENKTILALSGRLDTTTASKLQDALILEFDTAKEIVLDFAELAYVSSAGLRVLLLAEKITKSNGGWQTLINVSAEIMEVFEMTGFSNILNIE